MEIAQLRRRSPGFLNWFLGERRVDSAEALKECYRMEWPLAAQLKEHASLALYGEIRDRLARLADRREQSANLISDKLAVLGGTVPKAVAIPLSGDSNWARVNLDLQALVELDGTYVELSSDVDRDDVRGLLEALHARTQEDQLEIKGIVARADPYAVD